MREVFVPVSEDLLEQLGLSPDDLVPFKLDYEIFRPGEPFPESAPEVERGEALLAAG